MSLTLYALSDSEGELGRGEEGREEEGEGEETGEGEEGEVMVCARSFSCWGEEGGLGDPRLWARLGMGSSESFHALKREVTDSCRGLARDAHV